MIPYLILLVHFLKNTNKSKKGFDTIGVVTLVVNKETLKILEVQFVSEDAGEVIYGATLALKFNLTIDDLKDILAPS